MTARNLLILGFAGVTFAQSANAGCPCITAAMLPDFGISGNLRPVIAGRTYDYGPSYGVGTCAAHDETKQPFCSVANPPAWCSRSWCYVDTGTCDMGLPPFQSVYFNNLFYSYQTCGTENSFDSQFRDSTSSTARPLPEIATIASNYVRDIIVNLENSEAELNAGSSTGRRLEHDAASCSYDSTCPCCGCSTDSRWGSAPPLTFQQTLTLEGGGNVPGIDACLGDIVGETFQRIASSEANAARVGYEYYGSAQGTYMQWPGMEDCSTTYDPRFREWYAGAAAGPKDIIIVIDKSGSMGSQNRMELAKQAADRVVDTLTDADYAQVVAFSSDAVSMSNSLVQATRTNRQSMKNFISGLSQGGLTSFADAMDKVETIFQGSATSGCNKVVLFLSDGVPNTAPPADQFLSKLNGAHLLTYALGSGADSSVLKTMACANQGISYEVADGGNLGDVMAEYYKLLAPMMSPCLTRWVNYQDTYTNQNLLGVCKAAFRKPPGGSGSCEVTQTNIYSVPELIGVACIDMSLIVNDEDLRGNPGYAAFEAQINTERTNCPMRNVTEQQLQILRHRSNPNSVCPGSTAALSDLPTYSADASTPGVARQCSSSFGGSSLADTVRSSLGGPLGAGLGGLAVLIAVIYMTRRYYANQTKQAVEKAKAEKEKEPAQPTTINIQMTSSQPTPAVMAVPMAPAMGQPPMGSAVPMGQPTPQVMTLTATVPGGQLMQYQSPTGQMMNVQVPPGVQPGQQFQFQG